MRRKHITIALLLLWVGSARAGGVLLPGYGSQAQPRAGAFVAKADDPSALYHNPAGVARQSGTVILIGFNLVDFSQTFTRSGVYEATGAATEPSYVGDPYPVVKDVSTPAIGIGGFQAIPLIAVSTDLGLDLPLRFGFGVIAAHGYPEREYFPGYTFEDPNVGPPPQRYDVMELDVYAALPSVAVAYSPTPKLDVGARLSYGFAGISGKSAVWGIRNYEEDVANDGVFEVDTSDPFVTGRINAFGARVPVPLFGAGALFRPTDNIELGASYRSAVHLGAKGEGTAVLGSGLGIAGELDSIVAENDFPICEGGGTDDALKACLDYEFPQTFGVGGRWIFRGADGRPHGDVEIDVEWEDWSNSSDFTVAVDGRSALTGLQLNETVSRHGFRDGLSFRAGGSYDIPVGTMALQLRAGAAYDTAVAPESWTRVDVDGLARTTLGAGVALTMSRLRIELGGGAVLEAVREVDRGCNPEVGAAGCEGNNADATTDDRTSPDPLQPLQGPSNQVENPINDGRYDQGYILLSLGVSTWF